MSYNYNRKSQCLATGNATEIAFDKAMAKIGIVSESVSRKQDMNDKIDRYISNSKDKKPVQIKALPKDVKQQVSRCIEFKTGDGKDGWMFKGELVAFETATQFLIISIDKIWNLVEEKLDFTSFDECNLPIKERVLHQYEKLTSDIDLLFRMNYMQCPLYGLYTRKDWYENGVVKVRYDFCTRIPIVDLEKIALKVNK